jgi:4-hydroxy-tetrahydrodipicolinate synthase
MSNHPFSGTGVAIATPFTASGDLDMTGMNKLVDHLIEGGVEYLVVLGTTGESATLNKEEKQQVFSKVNEFNQGRIRLVAGIGGNDTREVVKALQSFDLTGYSAVLSVSPYYNKPNQEGLFQHYKAVNDASPLPVLMYNVPGRTGMNVSVATTLRIARECKNIIATKEASGNMEQIMQIIAGKPDGFEVISGDDGITLPLIACGAIGVISVAANAYPRACSDMVRQCLAGDFAGARYMHEKMLPIVQSMFAEGSPSGLKAYLAKLDIAGEYFRLPVVAVSNQHRNHIHQLMNTIG